MDSRQKFKVLIAGIGGASLGTELLKCLEATNKYCIIGCDISRLAYGHYMPGFQQTYVVDASDYLNSVISVCMQEKVDIIIPGGEQPLQILSNERSTLASHGITLAANSPEIISVFTDKIKTFEVLQEKGFAVPLTIKPVTDADFNKINYPCIIKPSTGSGGSSAVIIAPTKGDALQIWRNSTTEGQTYLLQEYIPHDEGEFSIGVLSLPNYEVVDAIALKKTFENKMSLHSKNNFGIVSSPYSSGLIEEFAELCQYAKSIASAIGSTGPLNIQGRMHKGKFLPFEINPRFSGSEYIRTMAGFNQLDIFLTYLKTGITNKPAEYRMGYYLRGLTEMYVPSENIKQ